MNSVPRRATHTAPKKTTNTHSRWYYYAALMVTTVIWAAVFVVAKPAFEVTTPFRFLFYRFVIASAIGIPLFLYYLPRVKKVWSHVGPTTLLEILGVPIALSFLYTGLERTSSIEAGFITTTMPLFVVFFGIWLLKEKQEKNEWRGLALAFFGTLVITFAPFFSNPEAHTVTSFSGNTLIFIHNCAIALYYVLAKKRYRTLPKFFVASISFGVGAISFFFLSLAELQFSIPQLASTIAADLTHRSVQIAALYMGILGSVVAFTTYIIGQDGIEASEATLFNYLQPLIYVPLGVLLLGESVDFIQILALGVILVGVVLAEWKGKGK